MSIRASYREEYGASVEDGGVRDRPVGAANGAATTDRRASYGHARAGGAGTARATVVVRR